MADLMSGNVTVDAMGKLNISGNVVPQIWYRTITKDTGKPYLLAITLLADIVYWYRPVEIRDESSGQVIGWNRKFKGDLLQKTYQQYADLFGESKRAVKAALDRLEEIGVIKKIFRDIECENGLTLYNLMFISLDVDVLEALTYPEREEETTEQPDSVPPPTKNCTTPYKNLWEGTQKNVGGDTENCNTPYRNLQEGIQKNVPPHTKNCRTNTEITTENTDKNYNNPINQSGADCVEANINKAIANPNQWGVDEANAYKALIRDNIEYEHHMKYLRQYGDKELYEEIYEIICDIVCVEREKVRIGGEDYPYNLVKSRFLKLNAFHVEYVMECMKGTATKITNIRSYLITALYYAPTTINHYYQQEVQHDMFGGVWNGKGNG